MPWALGGVVRWARGMIAVAACVASVGCATAADDSLALRPTGRAVATTLLPAGAVSVEGSVSCLEVLVEGLPARRYSVRLLFDEFTLRPGPSALPALRHVRVHTRSGAFDGTFGQPHYTYYPTQGAQERAEPMSFGLIDGTFDVNPTTVSQRDLRAYDGQLRPGGRSRYEVLLLDAPPERCEVHFPTGFTDGQSVPLRVVP